MSDIAPVIAVISVFLICAWIVRSIAASIQRSKVLKIQAEIRSKILEKVQSGPEALEFMNSEAGQKMLEPLPLDSAESPGHARILKAAQVGIILVAVGIGQVVVAVPQGEDQQELAVFAVLALSLGVGFLVAGAASYLLSRSWGLLEAKKPE